MNRLLLAATLSLLLCLFASLVPVSSQNPPADPLEISRDLLFLAPDRIQPWEYGSETGEARLEFVSAKYLYVYSGGTQGLPASPDGDGLGWRVSPNEHPSSQPEPERKNKLSFSLGGEDYTVSGASDDERATVELRRTGAAEPFASAVVWTRDRLATAWLPYLQRGHKGLTEARLRHDLEVGDPILYAIDHSGDSVWVAVGHSTGEGELGLGTVVRFDVKAKEAKALQPAELATCAVTQLAPNGADSLLLGTRRQYEGTILPCAGLLNFHPSNGKVETIALTGTPPQGAVVTALGSGWVATDQGICRIGQGTGKPCWRIVPTVTLKSPTPVNNRPGQKPSGNLKPGDYEVLWANQNFLEVATKDSFDAWLAADDYAEAAARHFDVEPYKLLNSSNGPAPIRPLAKPRSDPLVGALVYRALLEKLPAPEGAPLGWVRVRARVGWIPRAKLEIVPRLVAVEK